jgi:hypothetical protein
MCSDFGSAASLKYSFVLATEVISSLAHHEPSPAHAISHASGVGNAVHGSRKWHAKVGN